MRQDKVQRDTSIARQYAMVFLDGRSPREVGEEKILNALTFIYRWGWSTPTIIDQQFNRGRRGLSAKLVKHGLAKSERTEAYGGIKGVPLFVITLTEAGVQKVEANIENINPYETFYFKNQIVHDITVQRIITQDMPNYLKENFDGLDGVEILDFFYKTPRELSEQSTSGKKQPDSALELIFLEPEKNMNIAFELELTAKKGREFDQTIWKIITAIQGGIYDEFIIFSSSETIIDRYTKALSAGEKIQLWDKGLSRHWIEGKKIDVPIGVIDKIKFEHIKL